MDIDIRSPDFRRNPYPIYQQLRDYSPVYQIPGSNYWMISRYADVVKVIRNPKIFSSSENTAPPSCPKDLLLNSRGMVDADPPAHSRLRSVVSKAFAADTIAKLETDIRIFSRSLICKIVKQSSFDMVKDFAMPLPILVLSNIMGIDASRLNDFQRWTKTLISWRNRSAVEDKEKRAAYEREIEQDIQDMLAFFLDTIEQKKNKHAADLISILIQSSDAKQKLSPAEILEFIRLLLVAGTETMTNLMSNTVLALLANHQEWQLVQNDHSLIPDLIEESLRFDSPVLSLMRRVCTDTEIAGVKLPADDFVFPLLGSANHDASQFSDPKRFWVGRKSRAYLSLGSGIHFCLGAQLVRLQARIAFEEIFSTFENFEKADQSPLKYFDSFFFRGVENLQLNFVVKKRTSSVGILKDYRE